MARQNLIEIVIKASDLASAPIKALTDTVDQIGGKVANLGSSLMQYTAPFVAGLTLATGAAMNFDEAMTNVGAVLGANRDQIAQLSDEILAIGENSRAGPQAVAESFYDVVGGVADASTHMAILNAAVATAEAGNAALGSTTNAMISIMNAYGFSAEQAGFASDVLTQTVAKGVGTMDEFAAALPQISGLAHSLGIDFDDLAAATAYLTTKGFSASESATQLRAMMTALLNPNERMKKALEELGAASGTAAIEQYGLVGAFMALQDQSATFQNEMTGTLGSVEAVNGVIALAQDSFVGFSEAFKSGVDGATAAAREIQLDSAAAQFDLLKSSISAAGIELGEAFLPVVVDIIKEVRPVISSVTAWARANPELIKTLGMIVAGLGVLGPTLFAVGKGIQFVSFALTVLTSPIGLVVAAIAAFALAYETNFLGLKDTLAPVVEQIAGGIARIAETIGFFIHDIQNFGLQEAILGIFGKGTFGETMQSSLEGVLVAFGVSRDEAIEIVNSIYTALQPIIDHIGTGLQSIAIVFQGVMGFLRGEASIGGMTNIFDYLFGTGDQSGGLAYVLQSFGMGQAAAQTFVTNVRGALESLASFVTGTVVPAVQALFTWLGNAWTMVQPGLSQLADWFINTALPRAVNFITGVVVPAIQNFIQFLGDLWTRVQPGLSQLVDWFLNTGLPTVVGFVQGNILPFVESFIATLVRIWNDVSPFLAQFADWFIGSILPTIVAYVRDSVIPFINDFINAIATIWQQAQPGLELLYTWFVKVALPQIIGFLQTQVTPAFQLFVGILANIWAAVRPALTSLYNWFRDRLNEIVGFIQKAIDKFNELKAGLGAYGGVADNYNTVTSGLASGQFNIGQVLGATVGAIGAELRDSGGRGRAGQPYIITPKASPEVYVPDSAGTFYPNADLGGNTITVNFNGTGGPTNQREAEDAGFLFVNGLRARGVEI